MVRGKALHVLRDSQNLLLGGAVSNNARNASLQACSLGAIDQRQLGEDLVTARIANKAKHSSSTKQIAGPGVLSESSARWGDSSISDDDVPDCWEVAYAGSGDPLPHPLYSLPQDTAHGVRSLVESAPEWSSTLPPRCASVPLPAGSLEECSREDRLLDKIESLFIRVLSKFEDLVASAHRGDVLAADHVPTVGAIVDAPRDEAVGRVAVAAAVLPAAAGSRRIRSPRRTEDIVRLEGGLNLLRSQVGTLVRVVSNHFKDPDEATPIAAVRGPCSPLVSAPVELSQTALHIGVSSPACSAQRSSGPAECNSVVSARVVSKPFCDSKVVKLPAATLLPGAPLAPAVVDEFKQVLQSASPAPTSCTLFADGRVEYYPVVLKRPSNEVPDRALGLGLGPVIACRPPVVCRPVVACLPAARSGCHSSKPFDYSKWDNFDDASDDESESLSPVNTELLSVRDIRI